MQHGRATRHQRRCVDVVFKELSVSVGGSWRQAGQLVLHGVSGRLRSGELAGLMGRSGEGKTTLMDALAGRTPSSHVSGTVLYGRERPSFVVLQRQLAYVEQQDTLIPNLTVREMLQYAAELAAPPGTPGSTVLARAEEVLGELGLQSCQHTMVGGYLQRGVSGGQRRRVSIGVALVRSPAVLLLDEPTSGLDSSAALEVISILRAQADRGVTVLASVHQPSERLLSLFDTLLVLAGGHLVYQGCGDGARLHLQQCLPAAAARLDGTLPLPDWLLDCVDQAHASGELEQYASHTPGSASSCSCKTLKDLEEQPQQEQQYQGQQQLQLEQPDPPAPAGRKGVFACLWVLLKYRMRADYRSPLFVLPRVLDKLAAAFLIATLFIGMGDNITVRAAASLINMLFMWIMLPGLAAAGYIPALWEDTALCVRERHAGLYPITSYLAAKLLEEMLILVVVTPPLAAMVWFLDDLSGSYLLLWLPYLLSMCIGVALAYICTAVSPTLDICILVLAGYVIYTLFLAGLVLNWVDIPGYWKWAAYCSYMRYAWGACIINQFGQNNLQLGGGIGVLEYYGLDGKSAWGMVGVQCGFLAFYLLAAWAALWMRESRPRWQLPAVLLHCWRRLWCSSVAASVQQQDCALVSARQL